MGLKQLLAPSFGISDRTLFRFGRVGDLQPFLLENIHRPGDQFLGVLVPMARRKCSCRRGARSESHMPERVATKNRESAQLIVPDEQRRRNGTVGFAQVK